MNSANAQINPNSPLQDGLVLAELLMSLAILGVLLAGLNGLFSQTVAVWENNSMQIDNYQQAYFALERMRQSVLASPNLLIPKADDPGTSWDESSRDVLALSMDPRWDRDNDGFVDVDNDKDGLIDEDMGSDNNFDGAAGILSIDDDGDGAVDEDGPDNNDEQGTDDDDPLNGIDDDGDSSVDEDLKSDMNEDDEPGIAGVDDDDDDGSKNEDWMDTVVYYLDGTSLIERLPNINPIDGTDYSERAIAEGVTGFTIQRVSAMRAILVTLNLTLTDSNNETLDLSQTLRVGSRQ